MALKQAAVTVTDASGTQDLIVPLGTTVTGLLSMLDIDSTDPSLQITGADGRALNLGAVLGTDLPQGVLISITSGRERQIQEQRAIERTSDPWFRPSLALSICALLAFAMDAVLIFCTLFAQLLTIIAGVPWWAPLTIGVLSLALCLVVLYQERVHSNAGLLSGWTLAAGLSFLGVLPALGSAGIYLEASQISTMSQVAALLFPLWGATGVALGLWLWRPTPLTSAHALSWGVLTASATVLTYLNASLTRVAPFAIACAVCAITASPSLSVRIPATQLLDMPLVTTSAPTVRAPEVPSPSRITGRRVNRTVTDATSRTRLVQYLGLGLIIVAVPVIYSMIGIHRWCWYAHQSLRWSLFPASAAGLPRELFPAWERSFCLQRCLFPPPPEPFLALPLRQLFLSSSVVFLFCGLACVRAKNNPHLLGALPIFSKHCH